MCSALLQHAYRYPSNVQVNQAAKGAKSQNDALVDLLESIELFLRRVDIYTRIPPTPATDEIVFKIILELLSSLALATKQLKHGRSSEFGLAEVLPYSVQPSQIRKGREECRGGSAQAGQRECPPSTARRR